MRTRLAIALAMFGLSGCAATADYGKIPHGLFTADARCAPTADTARTDADLPHFIATSRLPDCRLPTLRLTHHRSEILHYGRFSAPDDLPVAKGKLLRLPPLTLQPETAWWAALGQRAAANGGRVMLFVHGYKEDFASTSTDAAQIARLTRFSGPLIQYSWPSQDRLISYAVDEANIYWDERKFRKFLQKLVGQSWVKDIVIVSHSLGARLVLPAIEYVDRSSSNADASNISNIVLASPDIDRADFERDIAEEVLAARRVNNNRRITVYASSSDKALALSRTIHGYPRLGSPYCFNPFEAAALKARGLPERCYASKSKYDVPPERDGLTIIDTSDVSRTNAGHSDYLRSGVACRDFANVVNDVPPGSTGRRQTHLLHVFALTPGARDEDDDAACQRTWPPKPVRK